MDINKIRYIIHAKNSAKLNTSENQSVPFKSNSSEALEKLDTLLVRLTGIDSQYPKMLIDKFVNNNKPDAK